jgi:hypothetical protein
VRFIQDMQERSSFSSLSTAGSVFRPSFASTAASSAADTAKIAEQAQEIATLKASLAEVSPACCVRGTFPLIDAVRAI